MSGDQGMLQQRIHSWLGGVQERRNASGYVHFCAPMERALGVAFLGRETGLGSVERFPIFWGGWEAKFFEYSIIYVWIMHQNLPTF